MSLKHLLWLDCAAAFISGVVMLMLSAWLSRVYAVPHGLLVAMGMISLCYGAFSFSLARRALRPRPLILLLVAANFVWSGVCLSAAVLLASTASVFGLIHLAAESVLVGGLAWLEWTQRERLLTAK